MNKNTLNFRCGVEVTIKAIFVRETYYGVQVDSGSIENIERIKKGHDELIRELFGIDEVVLIEPNINVIEDSRLSLPAYICAVELDSLTPVKESDDFSFAAIEWYQETIYPELDKYLYEYAKKHDWKSVATGAEW